MKTAPARFDIVLVVLDPTKGSEIRKTRPCLVISPNEMNRRLRTVLVAPMTSTVRGYPTRVAIAFGGKNGEVALDQLRAIDRERILRRLGHADTAASRSVCAVLAEMFSP